ncbi:MAG: CPBP family intramembrane metalloprotease [Dorea sp.]|nr:CPBP family intramembrane metalloprotease [Dorea sp.]
MDRLQYHRFRDAGIADWISAEGAEDKVNKYIDFNEIKMIWKDKRRRKPYLAALLLAVLYIGDIFFLSSILARHLGIAGNIVHEMILAGMGVGVFLILKGKLKVIFPFKKPQWIKIAGTFVLWLGTYLLTMAVTLIVTFFFPSEVMGASEGVNYLVNNISVMLGMLIVAITPAICEEIAFRGALLSCFRGAKSKWTGIIIVSLFFGACHGSIWRMIPTAMLGVAMGYILLETENMIYNILFHFINNAVPVLLLGAATAFVELFGGEDAWEMAESMSSAVDVRMPLASVGMYMMWAGGAPLLIYAGRYLLHRGQPGYDRGLFPPEKKKIMAVMAGAGGAVMFFGFLLMAVSICLEMAAASRYMF